MEYGTTLTSSIDYPKNMSFVIFLAKCPLRCPYCSNGELVEKGIEISLDEIYEKIDDSYDFIDAIVISGGEPLVQLDDTIEILKYAKKIGLKTKLDTSGIYPKKLKEILNLNLLNYVAIDIKAPFEKYNKVINSNIGDKVKESMQLVNNYPEVYLECRTTYCPTLLNEENLIEILNEINCDLYTIQQFRNRRVLDKNLENVEEPNPHTLEKIAKKLKQLHPDQDINLKTAEFGQKNIQI